MKFEKIEIEGVLIAHIKIFMYLATKYKYSLRRYEREDLIQEQMLACQKALIKKRYGDNLSSYIYAVSENRLRSLYKMETRLKRNPQQIIYVENIFLDQGGLSLADQSIDVEEVYYVSEIKQNVEQVAKSELSKLEYYLYKQIIISNRSISEVARELSKTEKQISNGLTRIRVKMRQKRNLITYDI